MLERCLILALEARERCDFKGAIGAFSGILKDGKFQPNNAAVEFVFAAFAILSGCCRRVGDLDMALVYARSALEAGGGGGLRRGRALAGLAVVELDRKEFENARMHFLEALDIFAEIGEGGRNGVEYGATLASVAKLNLRQGHWQEALQVFRDAKLVLDNFKDHPSYMSLLVNLALCLEELQEWAEAFTFNREAVKLYRNVLGNQHPDYATAIFNLALAYGCIKQIPLAIPLLEEALAIYKKTYGEDHPKTVNIRNNLEAARGLATLDRNAIKTGTKVRMCNNCLRIDGTVKRMCVCRRVNYCSDECSKEHWREHKGDCVKCFSCGELSYVRMLPCSVCHIAKYCCKECLSKPKHRHRCGPRCYQCKLELPKEFPRIVCSNCKVATYCSMECQRRHQPEHFEFECQKTELE